MNDSLIARIQYFADQMTTKIWVVKEELVTHNEEDIFYEKNRWICETLEELLSEFDDIFIDVIYKEQQN